VLPGVERTFTSFSAAADEASLSRIYAGQHFRFDQVAGERLGTQIADYVTHNFLLPRARKSLIPASPRSPLPPGSGLRLPKEPEQVNAYELTIRGLDHAVSFATARWELFIFPEVYGLIPGAAKDEGDSADPTAWCRALSAKGHPATPVGPVVETGQAA
jgi:hypothetical protein